MTNTNTQTVTTEDLRTSRRFTRVMYRGTSAIVNSVQVGPGDGEFLVKLTRYNMCGTAIGALSVVTEGSYVWELAPAPLRPTWMA